MAFNKNRLKKEAYLHKRRENNYTIYKKHQEIQEIIEVKRRKTWKEKELL